MVLNKLGVVGRSSGLEANADAIQLQKDLLVFRGVATLFSTSQTSGCKMCANPK